MKNQKKIFDIKSLVLILFGMVIWSLTMIKSGLTYSYGIGFWGPNGHDGVWHIAVAQGIANGSWDMPVFAGEQLKNYHIGFDLFLAALHKMTLVPISILYFQILPVIFSLVIGFLVYQFTLSWTKSKSDAFWSTFFVYFSGSWGWVITFLRNKDFGGESMFWSQQSLSTLVNPPFALSLIILLLGLIVLNKGLKTKDKRQLIIATFLFGILVQIKVYAGILVLIGLFTSGIFRIINRNGFDVFKVFSGALILSIIFLLPITDLSQTSLEFKPFWFLQTLMADQSRLYWPRFGEALFNYQLAGNWIKGSVAYGVAFIIFLIGNIGIRIFSLPYLLGRIRNIKHLTTLEIINLTIIGAGIGITLLFVQTSVPWNTIQFMYYSLFFLAVFAGIGFSELLTKAQSRTTRIFEISALVMLVIPVLISTLRHYLPNRPPAMISTEELKALQFLRDQPGGVVLTLPFDKSAAEAAIDNPPRPLYLYESTAYVSAYTGKQTYLEDEVNLEITGYEWKRRKNEIENENRVINLVKGNNIKYIYVTKKNIGVYDFNNLEKIFENLEIVIYTTS